MTPEQHFHFLAEFVGGVALAGGTTPHVAMTVESMSRLDDPADKLWFAGCYALTYNWPTAERIFLEWQLDEVRDHTVADVLLWLEEHWAGLPLRKERKAVFRKPFFAESARAYANLARSLAAVDSWPEDYGSAFTMFNNATRYMGRYIAIRWLEVMRRAFPDRCAGWSMPDIRSDGGEHPRKALSLIYPGDADMLLKGNTPAHLRVADAAADRLLLDLRLEYGLETDYYELQSLLCEYKQSVLGRKQYPGKSIDTEQDYFDRVYAHWGSDKLKESSFFDVRTSCFPMWSLGEYNAWHGVRPELGSVLVEFGYTWSDAVYSYADTRDYSTFRYPQRRATDGRSEILA